MMQLVARRPVVSVFLLFFISTVIGAILIFTTHTYASVSDHNLLVSSSWTKSNKDRHHTHSKRATCPDYFRWIHQDLRPWNESGISRDMLDRGEQKLAHFRLAIIDGKVYVKKFKEAFQTRDVFTIWGILQLTKLYKLPDLELLFCLDDRPVVSNRRINPLPIFSYCVDDETLDIVFPDWTFWGWPETNVRPWKSLLKDINEGNKKIKWEDREPYAYWKGNSRVGLRADLMTCNVSHKHDWNARLYQQDWLKEVQGGFKNSRLEDQCTHRYKIYIEGQGWSVSEKYILACDSMTLLVRPRYFDFFSRGMKPMHHYWPIRSTNKCRDIKFAVDWGNNHKKQAQAIGKAGNKFVSEDLKMENVYNYMFHLLSEYAKLLKFKPTVPLGAEEVGSESMAFSQTGLWLKFMKESMVNSASDDKPSCPMLPEYKPEALRDILAEKERTMRQVEIWETGFWGSLDTKH